MKQPAGSKTHGNGREGNALPETPCELPADFMALISHMARQQARADFLKENGTANGIPA